MALFAQSHLEAIADALGDTSDGLTGAEIAHLLTMTGIEDTDPLITKRKRLLNAFAHDQNGRRDRSRIIGFIRKAMKPARFSREPHRFEPLRANLNRSLSFSGLAVDEEGTLVSTSAAKTLSEAARRAQELRNDLLTRGTSRRHGFLPRGTVGRQLLPRRAGSSEECRRKDTAEDGADGRRRRPRRSCVHRRSTDVGDQCTEDRKREERTEGLCEFS